MVMASPHVVLSLAWDYVIDVNVLGERLALFTLVEGVLFFECRLRLCPTMVGRVETGAATGTPAFLASPQLLPAPVAPTVM